MRQGCALLFYHVPNLPSYTQITVTAADKQRIREFADKERQSMRQFIMRLIDEWDSARCHCCGRGNPESPWETG
jgi:hypothetical protein